MQKERALKLVQDACVEISNNGCGYAENEKFQTYYDTRGIAIVVFDSEKFGTGDNILYDGRKPFLQDKIYIFYNNDTRHYDLILNLAGAVSSRFFCAFCNKKYAHVDAHVCE